VNYQESKLGETTVMPLDPLVGSTLAEKYEILSLLGRGGMSSVYKARWLLMNKTVAIKLLHSKYTADANAVLRFQQEAKAASSLSHPNIIRVWGFEIADERPFIAIDYLQGCSLFDEISRLQRLPLDRALHIWIQVCAGLSHAHKHGIIHRDLKPSNIMLVTHDGAPDFVQIVDFGIAKMLPQEGEAIHQLTQTGEVFGSPYYMSPEQCMGKRLDARSDIYSMGCLMYETVTGRPPFVAEAIFQTIQKHLEETPRSVKEFIPDPELADRLDFVLFKALAKDPSQRYQTMDQLAADLSAIEGGGKRNVGSRVAQNADMLQIKTAQLLKNKPIRLITGLLAIVMVLSLVCGTAVVRVFTAKIPNFSEIAWPTFQVEFEPAAGSDNLAQRPELQEAVMHFEGEVEQLSGHDAREKALRFRDIGAAEARNGLWERAAKNAHNLRWLMQRLPNGPAGLDDPNTVDRTKTLADYASIADACYKSAPTTENTNNALFFYKLASEQMHESAPRRLQRFVMKMADLNLRQKRIESANQQFQDACSQRRAAYPDAVITEAYDDKNTGVFDRAIFLSKVADVSRLQENWSRASECYAAAAYDWKKLDQDEYRAQAAFLSAICKLKDKQAMQSSSLLQDQAAQSLLDALSYYNGGKKINHADLAAIFDALAEVNALKGEWWACLENRVKARIEASKATVG
jgi:tRNA A-37 threonylcarbamoyl transferase component Bud32/alpha-D-ribose 1-methylphosphonate 5-triphosphate synthase subunit PhnG